MLRACWPARLAESAASFRFRVRTCLKKTDEVENIWKRRLTLTSGMLLDFPQGVGQNLTHHRTPILSPCSSLRFSFPLCTEEFRTVCDQRGSSSHALKSLLTRLGLACCNFLTVAVVVVVVGKQQTAMDWKSGSTKGLQGHVPYREATKGLS